MRIGVLRERKPDETRVALTPREVAVLVGHGHAVDVEPGAGEAAGHPDAAFVRAGAVVSAKKQILGACQLLLKVKAPLPEEYEDYDPGHILMTFLHFDENIDPCRWNAWSPEAFSALPAKRCGYRAARQSSSR